MNCIADDGQLTIYGLMGKMPFLCRLRNIATHRDHFVHRLSIRLSVCLSARPPARPSVRPSVRHIPIAMFRRRHMHSSECCHYFVIRYTIPVYRECKHRKMLLVTIVLYINHISVSGFYLYISQNTISEVQHLLPSSLRYERASIQQNLKKTTTLNTIKFVFVKVEMKSVVISWVRY